MKTEMLKIRVDSLEKQAFENAAELSGIALSAWIRERLRLAAIRDLESAGLSVPFVRVIALREAGSVR
jgi:hypothetical protein